MIQKIQVDRYFHIYADPEDGTGHLFCEQGANYERHIRTELERFVWSSKGFLDIGANVGFHTMLAKSIRRSIDVIAVEANPATVQLFSRAVAECAIEGITIITAALQDHDHVIQMDARFSNATCAALRSWSFGDPNICFSPCITLDRLNLDHIDLVKMDIDGHEYLALKGANKLLRSRPNIIFEYHLGVINRSGIKGPELLEFLTALGYTLTVLESVPGIRKTFTDPMECHKHVLATTGTVADILAQHESRHHPG